MQTLNAIYDNGKIVILDQAPQIKAKIKITFIEEIEQSKKDMTLPKKDLGKIYNIDRY